METAKILAQSGNARLAPFAALRYRDFRLLWFGQLVSQAGTQMQLVTINWHIYMLTGSAIALGLTGLVRILPILFFSLIGGVYADAHDRRRILLVTQSLMMLFAALLGLVTMTGHASAGLIYLLSACTAGATAFDNPARQSLAPNLVPRERLTNALSLNNMMGQTASVVGPGLAGFVIAGAGVGAVYWINAVSFLAVLVAVFLIKTPTQKNMHAASMTLQSLGEGIHYVRRSGIILSTMLVDFFATFFSSASALLPIFASDILKVGPQGLGLLYAADSVGSIVAGMGVALIGNIRRQGAILLVSVMFYGIATVAYGASHWFLVSLFLLALVGAADTISTILRNTIRQLSTPDHIRGRMSSVNMAFSMGGPQMGNMEAGLVAAVFGAPLAVITGGIATVLLVALTAWRMPALRNYCDRSGLDA